jgi:hypothetical protein
MCREASFSVAMRSKYLPPQEYSNADHTGFDGMELDLGLALGQQSASASSSAPSTDAARNTSVDWEQWGEESTIEITMVNCEFNASMICEYIIYLLSHCGAHT